MPHDVLVHDAVWRELAPDVTAAAARAMKALAATPSPLHAAHAKAVTASAYPRSGRLRVGRWRLLFIEFPDERTIVFTTAFLKRRAADYGAAVARHDVRVRAFE